MKDLFSRYTDLLREVSASSDVQPADKQEIDKVVEERDKHYQESKQYTYKPKPSK